MEKKKQKILIVDDDKFLLNMYALKFKNFGVEVNTASGGIEALRLIRGGFVPDIILLDIVMPVMDGLELLSTIKKEKLASDATVVMLTNQGQPADIRRAQEIGVDGYIVKATTIPSEVLSEVMGIYKRKSK